MKIDNHRADIIRGTAVMVDHADLGDCLQKALILKLIGTIGVNDDQCASVITHNHSILGRNQPVLITGISCNFFQQLLGGIALLINNNVKILVLLAAQAGNTHGRADGIKVRIFMTHNKHLTALTDQLH